jgi:ABC-type multidrug transport system ATPase subunit
MSGKKPPSASRPPSRAASRAASPDAPPTNALATYGLTKHYGDAPALEPLTLAIPEGQHVALIGHNGSGKTTLLKMCAGLLEPSDGQITVFGHKAGSQASRASLSWLSDTPTFYDDLSLWEHLEYVARLHGVQEWQPRAAELLDELGLAARRDDLPVTFSRGLRQKAAIALGFVRPMHVLLVDEPFVGLDSAGKQALLGLFDQAAAAGVTLIVATHELTFVERVSRLLALRDGALVYDGPPTDADLHDLVQSG